MIIDLMESGEYSPWNLGSFTQWIIQWCLVLIKWDVTWSHQVVENQIYCIHICPVQQLQIRYPNSCPWTEINKMENRVPKKKKKSLWMIFYFYLLSNSDKEYYYNKLSSFQILLICFLNLFSSCDQAMGHVGILNSDPPES